MDKAYEVIVSFVTEKTEVDVFGYIKIQAQKAKMLRLIIFWVKFDEFLF